MNAVDEENSIGDDKSPESSKLPKKHETNRNEGRILCHGFVIQLFLSAVEQRQNTLATILYLWIYREVSFQTRFNHSQSTPELTLPEAYS